VKILLATKNIAKVDEMNTLLSELPVEFVWIGSIIEELPKVIEDGVTYHDNAMKKAMTFYNLSLMPTLAEDSGLEVLLLNGAPGICSARFAGEGATDKENIQKLLQMLKGVPFEKREAKFVSVLCFVLDGKPHFFEGEIKGYIAEYPSGDTGFGYDPIFIPENYNKTFAELGIDIKNTISHRAKAIQKFRDFLRGIIKE